MRPFSFNLRCDTRANVMWMTQEGDPDVASLQRMTAQYGEKLKLLRPGWVLVNDQRNLGAYSEEGLKLAAQQVRMTNESECKRVIRIVPAELLARLTLKRALIGGSRRYEVTNVDTLEAAQAELAHSSGDTDKT